MKSSTICRVSLCAIFAWIYLIQSEQCFSYDVKPSVDRFTDLDLNYEMNVDGDPAVVGRLAVGRLDF